jgi:WD40 repeat protein
MYFLTPFVCILLNKPHHHQASSTATPFSPEICVYSLKLYDTDVGVLIWSELYAHHGVVYDVKWSKDDSYLLSSSGDGTTKIWDVLTVSTGTCVIYLYVKLIMYMNIYICMYIHICIYIYVYMCTYIYMYIISTYISTGTNPIVTLEGYLFLYICI